MLLVWFNTRIKCCYMIYRLDILGVSVSSQEPFSFACLKTAGPAGTADWGTHPFDCTAALHVACCLTGLHVFCIFFSLLLFSLPSFFLSSFPLLSLSSPLLSLTYHNAHRLLCPCVPKRLRKHKGCQLLSRETASVEGRRVSCVPRPK